MSFSGSQLRLDDIRRVVVDRYAQKDDAVHHQPREDVHRRDVHLPLLDDRRRNVFLRDRVEPVQLQAADPGVAGGVFLEFAFTHSYSVFTVSTLLTFKCL